MNKKHLCIVLAISIILASAGSVYADSISLFPDIPENAEYLDAVVTLASMGIIKGDGQGNFNPDSTITRAEAAAIICRILGVEQEAKAVTACAFADLQGHWAVGYVAKAAELGIINGYNKTTFGPDDPVTYAQMVKMLVCACDEGDYAITLGGYPDGYLLAADVLGITSGVSFQGTSPMPRRDVAVFANNILNSLL